VSLLQDDKQPVTTSRPNRLKDVEVSLRDQIPQKLLAKLEEAEITHKLDSVLNLGDSDRAIWLERQKTYLAAWDEFLESSAEGAFEGSSNLHLPIPLIVARALHARFLQALLGVEPYFSLKARTEGMKDRADLISDTLTYALKTLGQL
jgi:hypothetical protein